MYFNRQYRVAIWAVSLSVSLGLFLLVIMLGIYTPKGPYLIPIGQRVNNTIGFGILISLIPPALVEFVNSRWLQKVEENIPRFLRDITEAVTSGLPLIAALEEASNRDYGSISIPLQEAMVKFNLTSDLESSFNWLGEKLERPAAKHMSSILIEAYRSGGSIIDVLTLSVDLFTSIAEYREEKTSQMRPYLSIVYLGIFVFLAISYIVLVQFLIPLSTSLEFQEGEALQLHNILEINYYKSILFWAAVMESLVGGLIAGKMSHGRIKAGLIHSTVLLLLSLIFFNSFSV